MLISISGKLNSGKDTVGKIIQLITDNPHFTNQTIEQWLKRESFNPKFQIKKWADSLKDMVCIILGCTREQLEDREFKETELGEEWWYYTNTLFNDESKEIIPYLEVNESTHNNTSWYIIKFTPRLLLQLLGTECGRNIIHPNVWINALMSKYREKVDFNNNLPKSSNWIITDTRFPNELKAVKDKGGINIRVTRSLVQRTGKMIQKEEHESETALDNAEFNYFINNNGTIQELIEKVREILIKKKLI